MSGERKIPHSNLVRSRVCVSTISASCIWPNKPRACGKTSCQRTHASLPSACANARSSASSLSGSASACVRALADLDITQSCQVGESLRELKLAKLAAERACVCGIGSASASKNSIKGFRSCSRSRSSHSSSMRREREHAHFCAGAGLQLTRLLTAKVQLLPVSTSKACIHQRPRS